MKTKSESPRVISPFAQTTSTVQTERRRRLRLDGALDRLEPAGLVILGIIGYFTYKYLNDPYRTLEPFPMDKYLADYRSMTGAKFKADLKVSADLGWKAETGRLMVFTLQNDNRPLVVLIPPKLSGHLFSPRDKTTRPRSRSAKEDSFMPTHVKKNSLLVVALVAARWPAGFAQARPRHAAPATRARAAAAAARHPRRPRRTTPRRSTAAPRPRSIISSTTRPAKARR